MKNILRLLFPLLLFSCAVSAQVGTPQQIKKGSSFPTCNPQSPKLFIKTGTGAGVYYCSATNTWSGIGGWSMVKKSTQTQAKNNNTTLVNDDALTFTVAANAIVSFRMVVFYSTLAAADFKFRLTGSNTPTNVNWGVVSASSGTAGNVQQFTAFSAADVAVLGTGTGGFVVIEGVIQNTSSSCTVNFQWAQNTITVGDTKVLSGSYVEYMTL